MSDLNRLYAYQLNLRTAHAHSARLPNSRTHDEEDEEGEEYLEGGHASSSSSSSLPPISRTTKNRRSNNHHQQGLLPRKHQHQQNEEQQDHSSGNDDDDEYDHDEDNDDQEREGGESSHGQKKARSKQQVGTNNSSKKKNNNRGAGRSKSPPPTFQLASRVNASKTTTAASSDASASATTGGAQTPTARPQHQREKQSNNTFAPRPPLTLKQEHEQVEKQDHHKTHSSSNNNNNNQNSLLPPILPGGEGTKGTISVAAVQQLTAHQLQSNTLMKKESNLQSFLDARGVTQDRLTTKSLSFSDKKSSSLYDKKSVTTSTSQQQQQHPHGTSNYSPPPPPKPRVSKLELEVQRLEAAGTLLVQRPGEEVAGLILLERAIFSRSRFSSLASDIWRRAEQLVVLCCQTVFRLTQLCDSDALARSKEILRIAERVLNPPPPATNSLTPVAEPFDGFEVLKRSLMASVRIAYAVVLSNQKTESPETVLSVIETGLVSEHPRPSAATLYNLAVAYVNAGRFEEAAACVMRAIDLVSHYTSLHLNLTRETEAPYRCFIQENATYSVLCHHLVASIGQWCNMHQLTMQHAILALRCAERCLGTQHALTTRCAQFVRSLEMACLSLAAVAGGGGGGGGGGFSPTTSPSSAAGGGFLGDNFSTSLSASASDFFDGGARGSLSINPSSAAVALAQSLKGQQELLARSLKKQKEAFGPPPSLPFQMSSFASEFLPSLLLPFTLVQSHPISFDLPPASASYIRSHPPPLLYHQMNLDEASTKSMVDASTARRLANEALRSVKPSERTTGVRIPKPPVGSARRKVSPSSSSSSSSSKKKKSASPPTSHHNQHSHHQHQEETQEVLPDTSPKFLSVIPLRDFDLYQKLQSEVSTLVSSTEKFIADEMNRRRHNQVSLLRLPNVQNDAVTNKYVHSWQHLRGMSYLRPDHTLEDEELWNRAAFMLQHFMRRFVAKLHVERRRFAVTHLIRQHLASDVIHQSWILYKKRVAAKRRLHFLRQKHSELECLTMVQSYLRFHQSIEEYAGHFVEWLRFKLWEKQHYKQMIFGATLVQAVWRSHACRTKMSFIIRHAVKLQRYFRKYRLYLAMRLAVFRRRQRRRAFFHSLQTSACKIQKMFRHEIVRLHALRELRRRQQLRDSEFDGRYQDEYNRFFAKFILADETKCGKAIMKFLRRCLWRRREAERLQRSMIRHAAATIVRRCFLRFKCRRLRRLNEREKLEKLRIVRRREEVREAVFDLQRFGRGFMERAYLHSNLRKAEERELAARRMQRFTQVVSARVLCRQLAQRREFERVRYQTAALRSVSALSIQCAWRRFVAKKFVQGYATFMTEGRNGIITKIQRAYRRHLAHIKYGELVRERVARYEKERRDQICDSAARRIQRHFRSGLQRRTLPQFAVETISELKKLNSAASRIQRRWRYCSSRIRRFDLQRERESELAKCRMEEHRVMCAVAIQRWLRSSKPIIQSQEEAAKPDLQRRMALRIQCLVRRYLARRQVGALQLCRDEFLRRDQQDREQNNAAILLQRNARMWNARGKYNVQKLSAKMIRDMWHSVFVRRQLRTERIMSDYKHYLAAKDGDSDGEEDEV